MKVEKKKFFKFKKNLWQKGRQCRYFAQSPTVNIQFAQTSSLGHSLDIPYMPQTFRRCLRHPLDALDIKLFLPGTIPNNHNTVGIKIMDYFSISRWNIVRTSNGPLFRPTFTLQTIYKVKLQTLLQSITYAQPGSWDQLSLRKATSHLQRL